MLDPEPEWLKSPVARLHAETTCGSCRQPGRCCNGFTLNIEAESELDALVKLATYVYDCADGSAAIGFPFYPAGQSGSNALFTCAWIQPDGKCGNYEKRPVWPCVAFIPGEDLLCVETRVKNEDVPCEHEQTSGINDECLPSTSISVS